MSKCDYDIPNVILQSCGKFIGTNNEGALLGTIMSAGITLKLGSKIAIYSLTKEKSEYIIERIEHYYDLHGKLEVEHIYKEEVYQHTNVKMV